MTADTSQVVVLQATAAPVAIPFDSERGRRATEEVAQQDEKPATASNQPQQQQQHGEYNQDDDDEQRRTATAAATSNDNKTSADDAAVQVAAQNLDPQQLEQQPQPPAAAPKWVRIGEKVRFSTVVAAVLIPSSHDLTPSTKRELWWQPADYADFRVNYATHMHNPSIELEEEEREASGAGPAPAVPGATNADAPAAASTAASTATATVEGVLVVAASPAPAPLTSRSPNPDEGGVSGGRRHAAGAGAGAGGGSHKVGSGAGGGAAAPSEDRVPKSKPSARYEKSVRSRPVAQQQHQQQYKNAPVRHRVGGGAGFKASPQPHHSAYISQHQFHGMQQQQQAMMVMQGQQGSGQHAAGFGRRDARHDSYLAPRGGGNMNNGRYRQQQQQQQQHNGRAGGNGITIRHGQQQPQQQFFVNGNPAGVNCPPQQQSRIGAAAAAARAGAGYRGPNGPIVEAFLPRHGAGGVTGGVAMAPAAPAQVFSSRVGGGVAGLVPRSAVGGGGSPMPLPFQACNSSQFSMWRSQVVFAPVMQMQ